MKNSTQKKIIFKVLDSIYFNLKLILNKLIPVPKKTKILFKRLRRVRVSSFLLVGGFSLFLILIFNIFYPIFNYDPELDFGINNKFETNYVEWAEDLENKVDLFRKKQFPQEYAKKIHEKWTIPNISIFTFTVNEIGRINELNSTIRIKGTIEAEYYPDDIKTPYFFDSPITKMAKNDVLSIAVDLDLIN